MTAVSGANVVSNGLVFHYDKANVQKSWKGKPTTNISNQTIGGVAFNVSFVETTSDGWNKYSFNGTWTRGTYPFMIAISATTLTGSVSYSTAWEIKCNVREKFADGTNFGRINYVNESGMPSSGTKIRTDLGPGRDGLEITRWETNGFQYSSVYANPTTNQPGYINSRPVSDGTVFDPATDFIWIRKVQTEEGLFATPFIDGARSNTQAIVDLTGNSTITPTSLAYTQDDFNFDGTSYLTPALLRPSPVVESTTYELIFRYNDTAGFRGLTGASTYQSAGFGVGFGSATTMRMLAMAAALSTEPTFSYISSEISHGVFVFNGRQLKAYRNGELVYSNADIGFDIVEDTRNIRIGNVGQGGWGSANSDIYSAKVYNKELTAAEINQNFEATRGRYGI